MKRLDAVLFARGFAPSRARAQAMIRAGAVQVNGVLVQKPAQRIAENAQIIAEDPCPYVSRAGLKLAHALEVFNLSPKGAWVLDLGASTGGFTQVCLEKGAERVWAVDVGQGQLHPTLAQDPRVTELSSRHAKDLTLSLLGRAPEWIVVDVSFIALSKALPIPLFLAAPKARLIALVKPQFELGREALGKNGVIRDPDAHDRAEQKVCDWLAEQGWTVEQRTPSPILGGDGNHERLITAVKP